MEYLLQHIGPGIPDFRHRYGLPRARQSVDFNTQPDCLPFVNGIFHTHASGNCPALVSVVCRAHIILPVLDTVHSIFHVIMSECMIVTARNAEPVICMAE